jgi:hypothetical protein
MWRKTQPSGLARRAARASGRACRVELLADRVRTGVKALPSSTEGPLDDRMHHLISTMPTKDRREASARGMGPEPCSSSRRELPSHRDSITVGLLYAPETCPLRLDDN